MSIPNHKFQFALKNNDGTEIQRAYADTDGTVTFEPIEYTLDNDGTTYTYQISEIAGDDSAITWDDHTETVTVAVSDQGNGSMSAPVVADADGAVFTNVTELQPATLSVSNTVEGTSGNKNDSFSFTITVKDASEGDTITYQKTGQTSSTLTLDSNGSAEFGLLHGEAAEFTGLFVNQLVTVTQGTDKGYTTTVNGTEGKTYTSTLSAENEAIFTNTRNMAVPTDADTNIRIMGLFALLAMAGICGIMLRKATNRQNETKGK
jgi:pilin isopeptide linkage protein